jgi:hypothetical protein
MTDIDERNQVPVKIVQKPIKMANESTASHNSKMQNS